MSTTTDLRATAGGTAVARCTAVPVEEFAGTVWGRRPSLSRAADLGGAGFADLFGLEAADHLLSAQGLRTPFVRVARGGVTLPARRYTSGGGVGATIADQVDDARLARLFADGATVVLQALHRTHPPIADFARRLTAELGHPVQVNAYVTPEQSQGFGVHYDVHDVFVLQVAGRKRWMVRPPVLGSPSRDQPWTDRREAVEAAATTSPLLDVVLEPGDALYLPRGFLHAATALGQTSAHLTVGVHVWTRQDLLEQLLAAAVEVEDLRAALPMGLDVADPSSIAEQLVETLRLFEGAAAAVPPDVVARGLGVRAAAATRPEPVAPLAQAAAASRVGERTAVRLRRGLPLTRSDLLTVAGDGVAGPAVARLLDGEVVVAGELGLGPAAALLRECLVVVA